MDTFSEKGKPFVGSGKKERGMEGKASEKGGGKDLRKGRADNTAKPVGGGSHRGAKKKNCKKTTLI